LLYAGDAAGEPGGRQDSSHRAAAGATGWSCLADNPNLANYLAHHVQGMLFSNSGLAAGLPGGAQGITTNLVPTMVVSYCFCRHAGAAAAAAAAAVAAAEAAAAVAAEAAVKAAAGTGDHGTGEHQEWAQGLRFKAYEQSVTVQEGVS